MTKTPIRLLDLFKYFKSKSHQIAAIGELEAAILAADPTILNREKDWYNTWSTSIKEKAPEWLITRRQVAEISGHNEALFDDAFMDDLNRLVYAADMTRLNQRRMLVAQTCHETCGYKYMTEIGDRAYFTRMYENRSDLGNTEPGDGYKYRGCGVIQLTGKYNFSRFHRWMERNGMRDDRIMEGTDYVANKYPFLCAICWIEENNWAFLCERGDIFECTRRLNGGYNGIDDRIFYYEKAKKAIKE